MRANPSGEVHGVIIPVPVSLMEREGTYRFVLHFYDDYADSYRNHQVKAALEVNQKVTKYRLDIWIDTYNDSEFRRKVLWHWIEFAFRTVARIETVVHPDDTAGNVDQRWLGIGRQTVSYRTLTDQQRKRAAVRTVIVTAYPGSGSHPGSTDDSNFSPKNPALSVIFTNLIDNNHPDETHYYAGKMREIGYTNAIIHELTHVANDDDSHCAQNEDTCIWRSAINYHFYGYDKNSGTFYSEWRNIIRYKYRGRTYGPYRSPWHSLGEINAMRRSMHHLPEFQAP